MLKLRMRNGNSNLLLLLTCALAMFASPALALDLDAVLARTMITPPSRVGFREVRHNRMLKDELIITGYLEYLQKGTLRKVIEAPFEEAYLIQSDSIEIERAGVTTTLSLRKSRVLTTMLGGIEAILAGETEELMSVFDYELSGVEEDWSLELLPRSKRIAKHLSCLTVTGNLESVTAIRFDLKDGEWHKMEIIHQSDRQ
jgi:hypothetical protein